MAKQKIKKENIAKFLICLAISLFIILTTQDVLFTIKPLKSLEQKFIDDKFKKRGPINIKDSAKVIILEMNNNTSAGLRPPFNTYPYPRGYFAKIVENLNEAGVKAIGFDVVTSEQDKFSPFNDSAFYNAIKKYRNVVVAGQIETSKEGSTYAFEFGEMYVPQPTYELKKSNENFDNLFYTADSSIGIVNVVSDDDGVQRRYLPCLLSLNSEKLIPSFGFAVLNKYFNLHPSTVVDITENNFILNNIMIPKFDQNSVIINFYGPDRTFPHYNFLEVLDDKDFISKDEVDSSESGVFVFDINTWDDTTFNSLINKKNGLLYSGIFKDKIVLIGSTEPVDKDLFPVSFGKGEKEGDNWMYGVEIHANAIQNVLDQNFLRKQSKLAEILLIIMLTLLSFYVSSFLKGIKTKFGLLLEILNVILIVFLVAALYVISNYLFMKYSFILFVTSPVISLVLGYFGSTAYYFITERKQKAAIKGMFSQYVNATIVDSIVNDPDKLKLGGERKELTIFFSDIAGFSTFSEKKEPEDLVLFLNEYLSAMTKIVFDNKGTLDKYIGDAVMAFWGAPIPIENHAHSGCKAALEMQAKLSELKIKWEEEGQPNVDVRMGINTGAMVVGNVGGNERFDYTVMGDNVNLASRLEGANKEYGTNIMLADTTYELVKNDFLTRELDSIIVKGKTKPSTVYELIGYKSDNIPAAQLNAIEIYLKALELYKKKNFHDAMIQFEKAIRENPNDQPSQVYIKRCHHYIEEPPPEDWDGVFKMKTK